MISSHTCSDRPLPTCTTSIVVTATTFTLFKVNTKETTKEVARPKAATFVVVALNMVNIVGLVVGLVVELVVGLVVELVVSQAAVLVVHPCRSACPFLP